MTDPDAFVLRRLEAIPEMANDDEVAAVSVVFPLKMFVPVKVFESARRVEDALDPPVERQVPLIAKHPFVILNPTFEVEVA